MTFSLFESVPNVSIGRNQKIHSKFTHIFQASGVKLLNLSTGNDTNRSVFTLIGEAAPLTDALFQLYQIAITEIDMRTHHGVHPRIGAVDVCPFVPLGESTMEECVELARNFGKRIGEELEIPVYLYGKAAMTPKRSWLPNIRKGEYEGLEEKLKLPEWKPDFGPTQFNPKSGATIIGARNFLIALNITLTTKELSVAQEIASQLRKKFSGDPRPLQAIGWFLPENNCTQVSTNILDIDHLTIDDVYEACVEIAHDHGTEAKGIEIVGLAPRKAFRTSPVKWKAEEKILEERLTV